jgi:hypothetical protein
VPVLALVFLDRAQWRLRFNNKNLTHHLESLALRARWNCKALGAPVLGAEGVCYLGDAGGV